MPSVNMDTAPGKIYFPACTCSSCLRFGPSVSFQGWLACPRDVSAGFQGEGDPRVENGVESAVARECCRV